MKAGIELPFSPPLDHDRIGAVNIPRNDSSPFVLAMVWSSRITAISLEMVVPALFGYWLDLRWGTLPLLIIVGVILGFVTATLSLLRLTKSPGSNHPPD